MKKQRVGALALAACLAAAQMAAAKDMKVVSERTVGGFGHPESVGYDAKGKMLYVGDFGPGELQPAAKDGKGKIAKVSLDGKIIDAAFLPIAGQTLNKPKGIWISGGRLWVTDIDAVWLFDLATREGKRLELPGVGFANDPTVIGKSLYISDNRADQLIRVEPADFLRTKVAPKIAVILNGRSINPNGLYPGAGGSILMAGFKSKDEPRGLFMMAPGKEPEAISDPIGQLDGLYRMADGDLLATDWVTGSLFQWNAKTGVHKLAGDFKGPADFAVVPNPQGLLVVVPDLVKGELRFIQLAK